MSGSIILPAKFDVTQCSLSEIKQNKYTKANSAYLNYNGGMSLKLQTPSLMAPFGLNTDEQTGKKSITVALNGYQDNPKVKALYNALQSLDDWMLEQGVKNSKAWFKDNMSKEDIRKHKYTPIVKAAKDKDGNPTNYPPNIKINLKKKYDSDEIDCKFVDKAMKPLKDIPLEEMLPKRAEITTIIQCTGLYFAGGKYGLSWKATDIRLDSCPTGSGAMGFLDEDSGESIPVSSSNAASRPATIGGSSMREPSEFSSTPAKKELKIEDSDEEEEEEETAPPPAKTFASVAKAEAPKPAPEVVDSDEEEAEHAPAAVPKKTVVTKKKVIASTKK